MKFRLDLSGAHRATSGKIKCKVLKLLSVSVSSSTMRAWLTEVSSPLWFGQQAENKALVALMTVVTLCVAEKPRAPHRTILFNDGQMKRMMKRWQWLQNREQKYLETSPSNQSIPFKQSQDFNDFLMRSIFLRINRAVLFMIHVCFCRLQTHARALLLVWSEQRVDWLRMASIWAVLLNVNMLESKVINDKHASPHGCFQISTFYFILLLYHKAEQPMKRRVSCLQGWHA